MGRCFRLLLAFACAFAGMEAACQEIVIFTDYRSLVVQGHRVDGDWTYLKMGSGEMAVSSASVLGFALEKTTGHSVPIAAVAAPSPVSSPPAAPAVISPPPWRSEPPALVPPPVSIPDQEPEVDDEEDAGAEMDEEEKEPDVETPPPPPGQPGKMPPQPNVPRPFPQPQEPGESKE